MKKKEFDPFTWDNVSIEKYYQILDILMDEEDDDITKNVRLVSVILDKDEQEVWDMDLGQVGLYISRLKFLNKFDLKKIPDVVVLPDYTLEVMSDLTKITIAQYVDYQNFIKRPLRESMDKIMSVFLIPQGKKYNEGYDIIDLQKQIRENMSFRMAEAFLGFFLMEYSRLLIRSLRAYRKMIRREKDLKKKEELMQQETQIQEKIQNLIHMAG